MAQGVIKKLTEKGFIQTAGKGDLFFHMSALEGVQFDDLQVGDKVSFNEGESEKGKRAENVKRV